MSLMLSFLDSKVWSRAALVVSFAGAMAGCSASDGKNPVSTASGAPVKVGDGVDTNGDGKQDGVAIDTNGDGWPDSVQLGDGTVVPLPVGTKLDSNGDGKPDGTIVDSNGDGIGDGIDTNGDGMSDGDLLGGDGGGPMACTSLCPGDKPVGTCGDTAFALTPTKTNVMFLIDGSASMDMYWNNARQAIADIVNANPTLNFGVHTFSAEPGDLGQFINSINACGMRVHDRVEVAPGGTKQGQAIVDRLGTQPPGAGNSFFDRSPVLEGMNWYLENDSPLNEPDSSNILVVFSDFVDTCFGTLFSNPGSVSDSAGSEQLLAFEKLAVELRKRHIRVIPMGFDGDPSNNGSPGGAGDVNVEALDSITKYGGTTISKALIASQPADVATAVKEIGVAVQPCRFSFPSAKDVNSFNLSFIIGGKIVPRDRTKMKGWDFVDGDTSEIEFFGKDCRALQEGKPTLEARENCSSDPVCGVGATKITNRAQAMHILLDGSGSMQGGVGGWVQAIFSGKITPWGEATSALAQMVVNPINDNVEFGFQFFPSSAEGGCGDVKEAEVPIKQGTEISIVKQLLSNIPNGTTPLVEALQYVDANPGRLVEKDVESAVLLVSDGGDSCAEAGERNGLLASSAGSLQSKGVDVYAVKFDNRSGEDVTAQVDQLNNIAINGGTAPAEAIPGNAKYVEGTPGYIDAPDGKALTDKLLELSKIRASCELRIGQPPAGAKADQLNVYLNGIVVPYDKKGAKKAGWGWVSDAKKGDFTKLELYGPQCELLQKSRINDLVIEFGCDQVVIQ